MSVQILKAAFERAAPPGVACVAARMRYVRDAGGREVGAVVEFDIVGPSGKRAVATDTVPHGQDMAAAVAVLAAAQG